MQLPRGALKRDQTLPSVPVRRLASDLGVNPNTVARAYQKRERNRIIATIPGGGTYVAESLPRFLKSEKLRRLQPYARQIAVEGIQLGLTDKEIMRTLQEELERLGVHK